MPWRVVGVCAHAPKGLVDRSCTWRRTVGDFSHRLSFRGPYLASYHTTIERHHTQRAPQRRKRGKLMLEFLLDTLHTRSPYDRTHHSHARCVHSHRPNAS